MKKYLEKALMLQVVKEHSLRKRALRLLALFLVFMFALTILSRAADSVTVARVTVEAPSSKVIEHNVEVQGKVIQNQEQAVIAKSGLLICGILVSEGEHVEEGQQLFGIDVEDVREQITLVENAIKKLELSTQFLESQKAVNEQKRRDAIQRGEEDFNQATQKGDTSIDRAWSDMILAQEELERFYNTQQEQNAPQQEAGTQEGTPNFEEVEKQLREEFESKKRIYEDAVNQKSEAQTGARRAIEDAKIQEAEDNTIAMNQLDIQEKEKELEKLRKIEEQEGKVYAPAKGIVTKLDTPVGSRSTDGAVITMADLSAGVRFVGKAPVSEEKYFSVGSNVSIKTGEKREILEDVVIKSVTASKEEPDMLEITALLPANTFPIGTGATMNAGKKSGPYSCSIPIAALRQNQNQYYVLVMQETETALGTEYTAGRVDVIVTDKNSSYAALQDGVLSAQDEVIVSSNKSIEAGSRVRLAE